MLPAHVQLVVLNDMVEVRGWAADNFLMSESSAIRNIQRLLSRRDKYTQEEFDKHLSVPMEAMKLMHWEVPEDLVKSIAAPVVAPAAASSVSAAVNRPGVSAGHTTGVIQTTGKSSKQDDDGIKYAVERTYVFEPSMKVVPVNDNWLAKGIDAVADVPADVSSDVPAEAHALADPKDAPVAPAVEVTMAENLKIDLT